MKIENNIDDLNNEIEELNKICLELDLNLIDLVVDKKTIVDDIFFKKSQKNTSKSYRDSLRDNLQITIIKIEKIETEIYNITQIIIKYSKKVKFFSN